MNITRYRRTALAALTLTVAALTSGCWIQPPEAAPFGPHTPTVTDSGTGPVTEPSVVIAADSLGAWAQTAVKAHLSQIGATVPWSYNALAGTQVDHWLPLMENRCTPGAPVDNCIPADHVTFIGELLTNDVSNQVFADLAPDLHAALTALADVDCVVWLTLNIEGGDMRPWPYNTRTRMVNDELLRLDADEVTYPNFHLVRWDQISDGHPEYLNLINNDPIHYSDPGNEAFADVVAHAPEACTS